MHKDGSGQVMLRGPCMGHGCPWTTGLGGRGGVSAPRLGLGLFCCLWGAPQAATLPLPHGCEAPAQGVPTASAHLGR